LEGNVYELWARGHCTGNQCGKSKIMNKVKRRVHTSGKKGKASAPDSPKKKSERPHNYTGTKGGAEKGKRKKNKATEPNPQKKLSEK